MKEDIECPKYKSKNNGFDGALVWKEEDQWYTRICRDCGNKEFDDV